MSKYWQERAPGLAVLQVLMMTATQNEEVEAVDGSSSSDSSAEMHIMPPIEELVKERRV
jgi:hypothetical protein